MFSLDDGGGLYHSYIDLDPKVRGIDANLELPAPDAGKIRLGWRVFGEPVLEGTNDSLRAVRMGNDLSHERIGHRRSRRYEPGPGFDVSGPGWCRAGPQCRLLLGGSEDSGVGTRPRKNGRALLLVYQTQPVRSCVSNQHRKARAVVQPMRPSLESRDRRKVAP